MFEFLVWLTAALCVLGVLRFYLKFRDPFHPAVLILPMFAFIYVLMPLKQLSGGDVFTLVSEPQLIWVHSIVVASLVCLIWGLDRGGNATIPPPKRLVIGYRSDVLHRGAYVLGAIGLAAWGWAIRNAGGVTRVFGHAKGMGYSDLGYIREAAYLMIVALLLLLSPEGFRPRSKIWLACVVIFSLPFLMQGILGAQRGPTFLIIVTLAMSWYLARRQRPSLGILFGGGVLLGALLLFLVVNRGAIYLGSNKQLTTNTSGVLDADVSNEYDFGAGCMITAEQTGHFYWGKRYLAQILVRPIPHQIWPTKYEDFGVPELLSNAGVAGDGLAPVMGWSEMTGAAAAMVADLWVEFSWLAIPVMFFIGYIYSAVWKRAVTLGGVWTTQYMIFALLSIYMVSQSGEAVIFRFVILTLPTRYVWRKAEIIAPF